MYADCGRMFQSSPYSENSRKISHWFTIRLPCWRSLVYHANQDFTMQKIYDET